MLINQADFHWEDVSPNEMNSSVVSIIQMFHIFFSKMGQMGKPCGDNGQFRDFDLLVLLFYLSMYIPELLYKLFKFAFLGHLDLCEMKLKMLLQCCFSFKFLLY